MSQSQSEQTTATLPKVWVGYILLAVTFVVEVAVRVALVVEVTIDPSTAERITPFDVLLNVVSLCARLSVWVYWLFCIYRMHKVLALVTDSAYPITPGQAVGYNFIPLYNLYWSVRWPREIAQFINSRVEGQHMATYAGIVLLIGELIGIWLDGTIGLIVIFSVGVYLTRKMCSALAAPTAPAVSQAVGSGVA